MVQYGPIGSHITYGHMAHTACMALYGTVWHRMAPYGPVWADIVLYGPEWSRMVPYGPVRSIICDL